MGQESRRTKTMPSSLPRRIGVLVIAGCSVALLSADCNRNDAQPVPTPTATPTTAAADGCTSAAVGEAGHRQLALLVGVGAYKSPTVNKLLGPASDVAAMRELLVKRYGFPPENVCTLVDGAATTAAFRAAFERALVARAAPNDVAVFYFSGHGSETADTNGDDSGDGKDETLLFQDARANGVKDLVDDDLNTMLARLHERTRNLVVILDSCNSGSATRDAGDPTVKTKSQPPEDGTASVIEGSLGGPTDPWVPVSLPGAVILTAASDGTSALEIGGKGVFTEALVDVLGRPGKDPLTYAQLARQIPSLIETRSHQKPYFQGDLDREAFGATTRPRPTAWEVRKTGPPLEIAGPPTPGLDKGAELRLYAPALTVADYGDPGKAKATIVVDESSGLNAKAHVVSAAPGAAKVAAGDLAILVRPSDAALRISVGFRPAVKPGGIPAARAAEIKSLIAADPDAKVSVDPTDGSADLELSQSADGKILVIDRENIVRNTLGDPRNVAPTLWNHAQQKALRYLHGENGKDFTDEKTLQVELVPATNQTACGEAKLAGWVQGPPNGDQIIPLCVSWNIRVTLAADAPTRLLIGGVVLSTDGATFGFPADDSLIPIDPGKTHTFTERFKAKPPLDARDMVRVFGTQETNPVPWNRVTKSTVTRSAAARGAGSGPLFRALDRYLMPGTRGVEAEGSGPVEDTTWTVSTVTMEVEANPRFAKAGAAGEKSAMLKEYTLSKFDIRPYLPDDRTTALYAVLAQADALARRQVDYKQHAWSGTTDEKNLALGIDCSRAIWFAFTRAGLPYNTGNGYLATAEMVTADSKMKEKFDVVDLKGERRLGDVLVYRDDQRGDGHVVLVIDPVRRIAWGSHGWDGNAKELPVLPQTGVEYQLIKYKPDWDRWDRSNMQLKAVWRYRDFSQQAKTGKGLPGVRALENPCDAAACNPAPAAPAGPSAALRPMERSGLAP